MKKDKEQQEQKIDTSPYKAMYPEAKVLYLVQVQEAFVPFRTHLEAQKHQKQLERRGVKSELHIVEL